MAAQVVFTLAIAFFPAILNACGSDAVASHFGHEYIHRLRNPDLKRVSDDKFDFVNTYPESDNKEALKAIFISTSHPRFFVSRISYHEIKNMLFFVGFELQQTCAAISGYMRRLENTNMFRRIRWAELNKITIDGVNRNEFGVELYLK